MKPFPVLIGLLAGLLFGLATPLSKLLLSQVNGFQLAGLLYLGAALAFLPRMFRRPAEFLRVLIRSRKKKGILGIILFGGILGPLFLMLGLGYAKSSSVSIWLNLELVATAILGALFFKDRLDRFGMIGLLLTVAAGLIVALGESPSGLASGAFIALACVCWGIDNHLTALADDLLPQAITFIKGLIGGLMNLSIGMVLSHGSLRVSSIPLALLIGVFSYGISIWLYVTSAQSLGATRSQILFNSSSFWGILAAFIFLREAISPAVALAFVVLAAGIAFTGISSHRHRHHHAALVHLHLHSHDDGHHLHGHPQPVPAGTMHSHVHGHDEQDHTHPHYPDIHHRHGHRKG